MKIIFYSTVFIVGFILVSSWSFWFVIRPPKIYSGLTPERFGMQYETLRLKTSDEIDIAAWFIQNKQKQPNVPALIFLHGYPAEKGDLLHIAREFHEEFDMLLIDFRSFGESGGRYTTIGKNEQLDLAAALDELERRGKTKIGVFGFSLGGATAIMSAARDPRINAISSYAAFADLKLLGREAYKNLLILKYPLVEFMSFWARIFLAYDITRELPRIAAERISIPVFLIHSKCDDQIPFQQALLLQKSLLKNPNAEFYFLEDALHGELLQKDIERIKQFFKKHLG